MTESYEDSENINATLVHLSKWKFIKNRLATSLLGLAVVAASVSLPHSSIEASSLSSQQELPYVSSIPTPQGNSVIDENYDRSWDNYVVDSTEGFQYPGIVTVNP
jgi:hypothetical protein